MVEVTCPCGTVFNTKPSLIKRGNGKYCGRPCTHKYAAAKRPSGLSYNLKNPSDEYDALHKWVRYQRGRADRCEQCGSTSNVDWANRSHEYKRDLSDWLQLCRKCHWQYDKDHIGAARKRYGYEATQRKR